MSPAIDPDRRFCWKCGTERTGAQVVMHRADNPMLAHERCSVCFDVLLTFPQPDVRLQLERIRGQLSDLMLWSRISTSDTPGKATSAALEEFRELVYAAHVHYVRKLDPDFHRYHDEWKPQPLPDDWQEQMTDE
ncbi:hypothetical protein ACFWUU_40290 [Kribbella sp. NPDC058693]|uniref:hypothetical protein n=1 Tax=Kribbella sp. NPDC058693 TaxID=3346602 RepID=UPI003661D323